MFKYELAQCAEKRYAFFHELPENVSDWIKTLVR